jgi:transposase
MVKAYGEDLRIRVVNKVKNGKESHQEIADIFEVGVATLRRWIKLHKDTGSVAHTVPIQPKSVIKPNSLMTVIRSETSICRVCS